MWENNGDGGDPRDGGPRAIYRVLSRQRGWYGCEAEQEFGWPARQSLVRHSRVSRNPEISVACLGPPLSRGVTNNSFVGILAQPLRASHPKNRSLVF